MSEKFRLEIDSKNGLPTSTLQGHLSWLKSLMSDYAKAHGIKSPQLVILHTSHDSPFKFDVVAEERSVNGTGEKTVFSPGLTEALGNGVFYISKGDVELVPKWISPKTLDNIPVNTNGRSHASYFVSDKKVTLSALERPALDSVDITGSITRYEGTVEVLNVHNENEYFFHLYPISGPSKVKCIFDKKDLDRVKDSVRQKASVTGQVAEYTESNGFSYPSVINMQEFEQLSYKGSESLDIDKLVEQFPTPPDVDAVKWVREIRDEWDDE